MTDGSSGDGIAALPIPAQPKPDQETRCDPERREVSINGGCFKSLEGKPPCAFDEYEHDGRCWIAVRKRSRPGQSVSHDVP